MSGTNQQLTELLDINNLPNIDIQNQTNETIQFIDNDILYKFNEFVLKFLRSPIDKILLLLRKRHENILLTVQNFAWIIWNQFKQRNEMNEQEIEFLRNVGELNRTMVDLDIDEHDRECYCMIEYVLAPLIFNKDGMKIFESIIENLDGSKHESSILNIISFWLDTISHTHYFLRRRYRCSQYQDPLTNIITKIIMSSIYEQSVEKHWHLNVEMDSIEQFYISSCSFYYGFILNLKNWVDIIEPLLYYNKKFVIFHVQSTTNQWSSAILNCMKSCISLITQYYEKIYSHRYSTDRRMDLKTNIFFDYDDDYIKSIITMLDNKSIQNKLLSTWSNDETIIIHMIGSYLLRLIKSRKQMKYETLHLLRTTDTIKTIYSLILRNDLYAPLQDRLFSLFSYLLDDNILYQLGISDQVTLLYYSRIEITLPRLGQHCDTIEEENMKRYLSDLLNILPNDLIQQEIIKLNKLDLFLNLNRIYSTEKFEILWALSFHSSLKFFLKNTPFLSSLRTECQSRNEPNKFYIDQATWGILWNLSDHQGLTRIRQQYMKYTYRETVKDSISITNFDMMINYHHDDFEQVDHLTKNLRGYGMRPLLNELSGAQHDRTRNVMIDTIERIGNIKYFIICLSETCARNNFCRSILQYVHKKEITIIPIIVQKNYIITHDWLYFIVGSSPITSLNDTEIVFILKRRIKDDKKNNFIEDEDQLSVSSTDDTEKKSSHDLYNDCKNNELEKIKNYINDLTIKEINKQQSNGSTPLHVAAYYGHYEIVKLLLSNGAWRSIRNQSNLTAYDEARTEKIRQLFLRHNDSCYFIKNLNDENVLEWTTMYDEIPTQRKLFRQQFLDDKNLSLDYQHILQRFKKNYLQKKSLDSKLRVSLNLYFTMAAEENDLRYILSAYTSPTIFHKILNRDLATYTLHQFDSTLDQTQDYAFSNSIIELIALLIHSKELDAYYCQHPVTSYRGMLLTRDDLKKYSIGCQIMNVSFLSTSKNKGIAQTFAGEGALDALRQTLDHVPIHLSTVCTYQTKNPRTALELANISQISVEEEILILPWSAYEVISIKKCDAIKNNGIMYEIELEECNETN